MSHLIELTRTTAIKLLAVLCSLIFVCILPFIILVLSPIYIFRKFISEVAKYVRPDLGNIVSTRSTLAAVYDVYSKPSMTVVVSVIIDGNLELEKITKEFESKAVNIRNDNNRNLRYPEIRQYLYNWMGFIFWKWDDQFDIKNHIRLEVHENCDKSKADEIRNGLISKPFHLNRSPWEIILIHDYQDSETKKTEENPKKTSIFFLRFHHAISDGFSIMKLIFNITESYKELEKLEEIQRPPKDQSIKTVFRQLCTILKCPYDLFYMLLKTANIRPWGILPTEYSRDFICATSRKIPIAFIKDIKKGHKVGFTSVLIAALTAGIRKALEQKQLINNIPEIIYCAAALPMRGHPDKLRNFMTFGMIPFPVGESDSKKRLMKCHQNLLEVKRSSAPLGIFLVLPLAGGLFHWMVRLASNVLLGGISLSNFAGPQERINIVGHDWLDISSIFGTPPGTQGVAFSTLTYVDGLRITALVDKNILETKLEVKKLVEGIVEELDLLYRDLI